MGIVLYFLVAITGLPTFTFCAQRNSLSLEQAEDFFRFHGQDMVETNALMTVPDQTQEVAGAPITWGHNGAGGLVTAGQVHKLTEERDQYGELIVKETPVILQWDRHGHRQNIQYRRFGPFAAAARTPEGQVTGASCVLLATHPVLTVHRAGENFGHELPVDEDFSIIQAGRFHTGSNCLSFSPNGNHFAYFDGKDHVTLIALQDDGTISRAGGHRLIEEPFCTQGFCREKLVLGHGGTQFATVSHGAVRLYDTKKPNSTETQPTAKASYILSDPYAPFDRGQPTPAEDVARHEQEATHGHLEPHLAFSPVAANHQLLSVIGGTIKVFNTENGGRTFEKRHCPNNLARWLKNGNLVCAQQGMPGASTCVQIVNPHNFDTISVIHDLPPCSLLEPSPHDNQFALLWTRDTKQVLSVYNGDDTTQRPFRRAVRNASELKWNPRHKSLAVMCGGVIKSWNFDQTNPVVACLQAAAQRNDQGMLRLFNALMRLDGATPLKVYPISPDHQQSAAFFRLPTAVQMLLQYDGLIKFMKQPLVPRHHVALRLPRQIGRSHLREEEEGPPSYEQVEQEKAAEQRARLAQQQPTASGTQYQPAMTPEAQRARNATIQGYIARDLAQWRRTPDPEHEADQDGPAHERLCSTPGTPDTPTDDDDEDETQAQAAGGPQTTEQLTQRRRRGAALAAWGRKLLGGTPHSYQELS